jgi:hypothetical protein
MHASQGGDAAKFAYFVRGFDDPYYRPRDDFEEEHGQCRFVKLVEPNPFGADP